MTKESSLTADERSIWLHSGNAGHRWHPDSHRALSIGDHIPRRRLALKMLQREVAEQIGVAVTSVHNWESNASSPDIRCMPAVIEFLRYNSLPGGRTLAQRLVRHRTTLGLTQREAASRIGVDPGTLVRWERGEREPTGVFLGRVGRFLCEGESAHTDARRAAVP